MKWDEFRDLLIGISPDTALGRIVAIRSEEDKDVLKHFTKEQRRIRNEWKQKQAATVKQQNLDSILGDLKKAFMMMDGWDPRAE